MNVRESDPHLRTIRLLTDYVTFLRSRQLEQLTATNPQLAATHVCGLLQPRTLRERITTEVTITNPEFGKDWSKFLDHVLDKAVALDEFCPISQHGAHPFAFMGMQPARQTPGNSNAKPGRFFGNRTWSRQRSTPRSGPRGSPSSNSPTPAASQTPGQKRHHQGPPSGTHKRGAPATPPKVDPSEIGRASCKERV